MKNFTFADICAGIGGFHLAFQSLGGRCVYMSECDPHALDTYRANFKDDYVVNTDILNENHDAIPSFDILCAGFPCQPFSIIGKGHGFKGKDPRSSIFYAICKVIRSKQPKALFLENVPGLLKANDGTAIYRVMSNLDDLGYKSAYYNVKACDYGLPQLRHRIFIIGFKKEMGDNFSFTPPDKIPLELTMSEIFGGTCSREIGYTLRVGGRGSGLFDRRNWDTYLVDNQPRRLTSREGLMMQGFPKDFIFPVSESQAMKQLGNSVAVPAVRAYASQILNKLYERI